MNEYNCWKAFIEAGFEEEADGTLRMGNAPFQCFVSRDGLGLSVKLSNDGHTIYEADVPSEVPSLDYWAALLARRLFVSRGNYLHICESFGDDVPEDLRKLIDYGFDNEEVLPARQVGNDANESAKTNLNTQNHIDRNGKGFALSVNELFRLLARHFAKRHNEIWQQAEEAVKKQNHGLSQKCLDQVATLDGLQAKINDIAAEWSKIFGEETQEEESESDAHEVTKPDMPKEEATEYNDLPITEFKVSLSDGAVFVGKMMNHVFADAISHLGIEKVSSLGIVHFGDPLLAHDRDEFKKMPFLSLPVGEGWFLKTQGNATVLSKLLVDIAEKLGLGVDVQLPKQTRSHGDKNDRGKKNQTKKRKKAKHHMKPHGVLVGEIVQKLFPRAFKEGRVNEKDVALLLSQKSSSIFHCGGRPVLKLDDGTSNATKDKNGHSRYYAKIHLSYGGNKYLLCSQFINPSYSPLVDWLTKKGFTKTEIVEAGKKSTSDEMTLLFPNLDYLATTKN